jgi:hypothetical protein
MNDDERTTRVVVLKKDEDALTAKIAEYQRRMRDRSQTTTLERIEMNEEVKRLVEQRRELREAIKETKKEIG